MTNWLKNGRSTTNMTFIALRGSQCQGYVEGHPCEFQARYFMLTEGTVVGLCGHHVNDLWLEEYRDETDADFTVYDAFDHTCEKDLQVDHPAQYEDEELECGYGARLLIVNRDTGEHHAACGIHTMQAWYRGLHITEDAESDETASEAAAG